MPRTYTICRSAERNAIDQALLRQDVMRGISRTFRVSEDALQRHKKDHLPAKLAKAPAAAAELASVKSDAKAARLAEAQAPAIPLVQAHAASEEAEAETLYEQLRSIGRDTRAILEKAKTENNHELALKAIARSEKQLELLARLLGELDDGVKVALGVQVNATQSNKPDLSKLSPAELDQLESLISKAQSASAIQITGRVVR